MKIGPIVELVFSLIYLPIHLFSNHQKEGINSNVDLMTLDSTSW